jgi:hypothetical protein
MPFLGTLADVRDVFIILYGIVGIVFFIAGIVVAIIIGMTLKSMLKTVKEMLDNDIKPAVSSVREAADTVRGTTDFVGRTAVQPIAKVYGTVSGVKRGMSVLANLKKGRRV